MYIHVGPWSETVGSHLLHAWFPSWSCVQAYMYFVFTPGLPISSYFLKVIMVSDHICSKGKTYGENITVTNIFSQGGTLNRCCYLSCLMSAESKERRSKYFIKNNLKIAIYFIHILKGVPQLRGRLEVIFFGRCLAFFLNFFGRHLPCDCLVTRFPVNSLPDPHILKTLTTKNGVSFNVCRSVTRTLFFMVICPESFAIGEIK